MRCNFLQICRLSLGLATVLACSSAPVRADGEGLPTGVVNHLARNLASSVSPKAPAALPADLLHIRISRRFLAENADTVIDRDEPVSDRILGAEIRGRAHISGNTRFLLEEHADCAVINAVFSGTIASQTTGYSGPVSIDRQSHTPVRASKQIVLDGQGMRVSPTSAAASTRSNTTAIRTSKKGLRGRITQRVARKRSEESQDQIDAIASQRAAERTKTSFDREVQKFITQIHSAMAGLTKLPIAGGATLSMRFQSTPSYLEIVVSRPHAGADALAVQPPPIEGDPLIAVRAHRSVAMQAVAGGSLEQMLPLLSAKRDAKSDGAPTRIAHKLAWSPDGNWVTLVAGDPTSKNHTQAEGKTASR
jgi:hypothetical protein